MTFAIRTKISFNIRLSLLLLAVIFQTISASQVFAEDTTVSKSPHANKPTVSASSFGYETGKTWERSHPEWSRILYESDYGLIVDEHGELYWIVELQPALPGGYKLYCLNPLRQHGCKENLDQRLIDLISTDDLRGTLICESDRPLDPPQPIKFDRLIPLIDGKLSLSCTRNNKDLFTLARSFKGESRRSVVPDPDAEEAIGGGVSSLTITNKGRTLMRVRVPAFNLPPTNSLCKVGSGQQDCQKAFAFELANSVRGADEAGELFCLANTPVAIGIYPVTNHFKTSCFHGDQSIFLPLVRSGIAIPDLRGIAEMPQSAGNEKAIKDAFEEAKHSGRGIHAYVDVIWR